MSDDHTEQGIARRKTTSSGTLRASVRYSPNKALSLNCRIDYKSVKESGNKGWLMSQDIIYKSVNLP